MMVRSREFGARHVSGPLPCPTYARTIPTCPSLRMRTPTSPLVARHALRILGSSTCLVTQESRCDAGPFGHRSKCSALPAYPSTTFEIRRPFLEEGGGTLDHVFAPKQHGLGLLLEGQRLLEAESR